MLVGGPFGYGRVKTDDIVAHSKSLCQWTGYEIAM